jgi:hypothetical protein
MWPQWRRCVQTGRRNWQNLLKCFGAFLIIFVPRQAGTTWRSGGPSEGPWALPQRRVRGSGRRRPGRRHRGAPPDGHQWVPAPWFPPHTSRGGCRLWGVGAAVWCPKWPVPLSRLFGGGLESHINPLKSVGTASGWCAGLVTSTYRPSVREDIRANALDPPRIQNPGLKSPLTQGAQLCSPLYHRLGPLAMPTEMGSIPRCISLCFFTESMSG